jgi:hypothetical protein
MNLIHNERTKLRANALDRLSTALLAVGVVGKALNFAPTQTLVQAFGMAGWIFAAAALHWMAYRLLGRLQP